MTEISSIAATASKRVLDFLRDTGDDFFSSVYWFAFSDLTSSSNSLSASASSGLTGF